MALAQSPFAPKPVVSMALDTLHENLYNTKKFDEAQKKVVRVTTYDKKCILRRHLHRTAVQINPKQQVRSLKQQKLCFLRMHK